MAKTITPINKATDTFDTWVTQTNTIIDTLATEILTANNNANGAFVTGNSQLFGSFTANVVAVYNELRGGNVQASGALLITSNTTVNTGNFSIGVDDTVAGLLTIYGGNSTTASATLRLYNNAADDTNAVYWNILGEDGTGDFLIEDDAGTDALRIDDATLAVTIAQGATITTGGLTITAGGLTVTAGVTDFGANVDLGIGNRIILDDDNDSVLYASSDDVVTLSTGGTVRITQTNTTTTLDQDLVVQGGIANVGVNDTTQGILSIFGGATAGGVLNIYNAADDDATPTTEYWSLGSQSAGGNFVLSRQAIDTPFTISRTTGAVTIANGQTITAGGLGVSGDINQTDGNLLIDRGGDVQDALLITNTDIGEASYNYYRVNNIDRWALGRNTGNNFVINRYNTSGVFQDNLGIDNVTGLVSLANGLSITTGGLTVVAGGIDVQAGVSTFSANIDLEGTARVILDADNDSDLYASADDTVVIRTGGTARMTINNTTVDYGSTALRTGGDVWIDSDTGDFRAGAGTSNLVANSSLIRLANSTVTFDITKPTAADVSNGNIFLAADGNWKVPTTERNSVVTSGTTAQIMDSWLKSTYRAGEYFFTVEDNAANSRSVAKVLVLHDNSVTNAYITEYGVIESNVALGSYSANCNTTHCIVYFTPTVAASTVKFSRDLAPVA